MSKNILEEIRKEQVIISTKKLIIDKGYSNFSMKDVASEMDMSTGIIYHYFENKEELLLSVLKHSFKTSYQGVLRTVSPLTNFEDKITAYIDHISDSQRTDIEFWILLLNYLGQIQNSPEIQRVVRRFTKNIRTYASDIVALGIEQGIIDEQKGHGLAELIIGSSMGIAFQFIVDPDDVDHNKTLAKLKEVLLNYLAIG